MNDGNLLNKIGNLLEEKLVPIEKQLRMVDQRLGGVEKRLDIVEMKVEAVNSKIDKVHQGLRQSIARGQEETIDALSELINTGYNLHEKRIKKIEKTLQIVNPQ